MQREEMKQEIESRIDYSIVIPVYFNEGLLTETFRNIHREVLTKSPDRNGEVIFIDDGSGDGSLGELMRIQAEHPECVAIIKLTRNFGQVNALYAGFAHARGKCVIAISADGQDPPGLMNDMLRAHFEEGYEIVSCERQGRDESLYRILTSKFFYSIMKKICFPDMPLGGFDYVLLGKQVVNAILRNPDAHPFLQGQILWTGFRKKFIGYRRLERKSGKSRWTFGKKLTYMIDGVMGYSFLPIRLISVSGIVIASLGFLYALLIFILKLFGGIPVEGWAPIMIVMLLMGGFNMVMLGVVGEYLWRTLAQVRNRDPYIIEKVYERTTVNDRLPK